MVTYNYLQFTIELEIPDSREDNTITVTIYDPNGNYQTDYWFTPESNDPQDWEEEAFESAQKFINRRLR